MDRGKNISTWLAVSVCDSLGKVKLQFPSGYGLMRAIHGEISATDWIFAYLPFVFDAVLLLPLLAVLTEGCGCADGKRVLQIICFGILVSSYPCCPHDVSTSVSAVCGVPALCPILPLGAAGSAARDREADISTAEGSFTDSPDIGSCRNPCVLPWGTWLQLRGSVLSPPAWLLSHVHLPVLHGIVQWFELEGNLPSSFQRPWF